MYSGNSFCFYLFKNGDLTAYQKLLLRSNEIDLFLQKRTNTGEQ